MNGLEGVVLTQLHGVFRHWERPSVGDWADVLAAFPLFDGVGKRRLRKLVRSATFVEVARGQTILSQRGSPDSLYVILGGAARALSAPAPRALGVGDYFGEMALIDASLRSLTVLATEDLQLMRLPTKSVRLLARQHPAITITMLKDVSRQLRPVEAFHRLGRSWQGSTSSR